MGFDCVDDLGWVAEFGQDRGTLEWVIGRIWLTLVVKVM